MEEDEKIKSWCQHVVVKSEKSHALYLGERTWVLTRSKRAELLIQCVDKEGTKMTLPPSGIFELPPACSAKTNEWYFPASLDGEDKWEEDNNTLPTLEDRVVTQLTQRKAEEKIVPLRNPDADLIGLLTTLRERNKAVSTAVGTTMKEAERLLKKTNLGTIKLVE
jgi:hypothetical protein